MKTELRIEKLGSHVVLLVEGNLTAQSASDFKGRLQKIEQEKGNLQLSLKNAGAIDVSALQLVRAFKQHMASASRDLQIIPPDSAEVISLLVKTGLFSILQSDSILKFNTKQK